MQQTELKVKLIAAFLGVKFIPPPVAFGHNNANPKLILREKDFEYRSTFFTNTKNYEEIETVDVYIPSFTIGSYKTTNVCLYFKHSVFTFMGNLNNLERLKEVLLFLKGKQCRLSEKANALLSQI